MAYTLYERYAHLRRTTKYGLNFLLGGQRTRILLAAFPKSGSTWLTSIIAEVPEFKVVPLITMGDRREMEIDREKLVVFNRFNYVSRLHLKYSLPTQELINNFGLRPVVLVRNIFDVIISFKDHIIKGLDRGDNSTHFSMIWVDEDFKKLDPAKRLEFIVDLAIPWYICFFLSWNECRDKILITYEDLINDTGGTVKHLLNKLEISASDESISEYIYKASKAETLKNVAKIGRGEELSQKLVDKVNRFASYYPSVDFTPIGIHL
jgi:hypothetical protein